MRISTIIRNLLNNFPYSDPLPVYYGRRIPRQRVVELWDLALRAENAGDTSTLRSISQEIGYENPWS